MTSSRMEHALENDLMYIVYSANLAGIEMKKIDWYIQMNAAHFFIFVFARLLVCVFEMC